MAKTRPPSFNHHITGVAMLSLSKQVALQICSSFDKLRMAGNDLSKDHTTVIDTAALGFGAGCGFGFWR